MTLDNQILEVIQQIGGIYLSKNITSIPVNLEYLEEKVAPGMEKLVVTELIMLLEDLFVDYFQEEKKVHKYTRYVETFKNTLGDNSSDGNLVGRAKRSA